VARTRGKQWLWTATTPAVSLFRIATSRDTAAFRDLLQKNPEQIKVTDRYAVYAHALEERGHGVCWAHLDRDFCYWSTQLGAAGTVGQWLAADTERLIAHWQAFRAGALDRPTMAARLSPVRTAVQAAPRSAVKKGIAHRFG